MHQSIILELPFPIICIAHTSAILLHDYCPIYDPPHDHHLLRMPCTIQYWEWEIVVVGLTRNPAMIGLNPRWPLQAKANVQTSCARNANTPCIYIYISIYTYSFDSGSPEELTHMYQSISIDRSIYSFDSGSGVGGVLSVGVSCVRVTC